MKERQEVNSQMSEAALWQGKYDQKVQEVSALRAQVSRQEAILAAIILDNGPADKTMRLTDDTIQFIADGGVAGFNREPMEDGLMIQVVLSDDAEEVEDDDVSDDEDSEDAGGAEGEDEDDDS